MDNNLNHNKELLKFLEAKSYKTLVKKDKDNTNNSGASTIDNTNNTTKSSNKLTEIIKNTSFNEASEVSNYITEDGRDYKEQDILINVENEELIYKILIFLLNTCKNLKFNDKDTVTILDSTRTFLIEQLQQNELQEQETKKLIYFNLKRLLGEDFKTKILLIKRATTWLGLNKLNNNDEYLKFLTKMSELGDMLSEDQGIKNEQHSFILTKEEAKKQRNSLISDDNFKVALTNKMHPSHKDALTKLRTLNKIIIS